MCQHHSSAAISLETKFIESVTFGKVSLQQTQVCFPLVTNDFAAGKTADRDNHGATTTALE
jgi:hypothetical protein